MGNVQQCFAGPKAKKAALVSVVFIQKILLKRNDVYVCVWISLFWSMICVVGVLRPRYGCAARFA